MKCRSWRFYSIARLALCGRVRMFLDSSGDRTEKQQQPSRLYE